MNIKLTLSLAAIVFLIGIAEARHSSNHDHNQGSTDRRPHPMSLRSISHNHAKQARVFPGAVAIKKLVLLKFKKIIPISLILLKSNNDNEAELVPVYPTSEIPSNVQFIPTPNGISGHKDVQAIAIPTEFHHQLELNGLANIEHIEALLSQAETDAGSSDSTVTIVEPMSDSDIKEDEQTLSNKDDDEDQLLEGVSVAEQTMKTNVVTNLRRLANEDIGRPGLKTTHSTTVEEIPLFLYSTKDTSHKLYNDKRPGSRYFAIRHQ